MNSLVLLLKSELDEGLIYNEQIVSSSKGDLHFWHEEIRLEHYTLGYNHLIFDFVLDTATGRLLVLRIEVPVAQLLHNTKTSIFKQNFKMTYKAFHGPDKGSVTIHNVTLECNISNLAEIKGHQITCMLNDHYLGRAQQCITMRTARYLCWKPTDEWTRVSPRGENEFEHVRREGWELACIRNANLNTVATVQVVPDNDAYSNTVRRLPRTLKSDAFPLRVTLYNFKFSPPQLTETTLYRDEFKDTSPRIEPVKKSWFKKSPRESQVIEGLNTLDRFMIVIGIRLRILFRVSEDEEDVTIEYVKLHIANYETTLNL